MRKAQGLHAVHGGSDEKDANVVKIKIESVSDLTTAEEKKQWKTKKDLPLSYLEDLILYTQDTLGSLERPPNMEMLLL